MVIKMPTHKHILALDLICKGCIKHKYEQRDKLIEFVKNVCASPKSNVCDEAIKLLDEIGE